MEWHMNYEGSMTPEDGETLIGYWMEGDNSRAQLVTWDGNNGLWQDADNGEVLDAPDYWIRRP